MPVDTTALLEKERLALLAAVDRVALADRDHRPAPGRWSVAEILEHLVKVEQAVANLIATRGREPLPTAMEPPVPEATERVAALRVRERRIDVPDALRPSGALSADDALTALAASRRALLDAARAADPVALEHRTYFHAVLGRLTLRDWLAFVAHHEARHAAQIEPGWLRRAEGGNCSHCNGCERASSRIWREAPPRTRRRGSLRRPSVSPAR
jgi:uncharacterized damage-inducible protein DinB